MMKDAGITTRDPERQLASSLDAIKSQLRNSIEDLETALKNHEKLTVNVPTTQYDAEANALKQQRDKLRRAVRRNVSQEP